MGIGKLKIGKFGFAVLFLIFGNTALFAQSPTIDSDSVRMKYKSPAGAMLRSAVIPGWGQLYNESYWKVPVMFGVFTSLAYVANWYHLKYVDYRGRYILSTMELDLRTKNPENYPDEIENDIFVRTHNFNKTAREFYRDNRDIFIFYLAISYFLNIIDAYVDAHLYSFNVDSSLGFRSSITSPQFSLQDGDWRKPQAHISLSFTF